MLLQPRRARRLRTEQVETTGDFCQVRKVLRSMFPVCSSFRQGIEQYWRWWLIIINSIWVCLKMGYTPNYTHLIGIMISKTIGFRGTNHFHINSIWGFHINSIWGFKVERVDSVSPCASWELTCNCPHQVRHRHQELSIIFVMSLFRNTRCGSSITGFTLWWSNIAMKNDHL